MNSEPYVNNINNFKLGVGLELLSTQYPNSKVRYYSKSWNEIGSAYNGYDNFGKELERNYEFDDLIERVSNLKAKVKVDTIFNYIRDHYTWNGYYHDVTTDGIENLISSKIGNTAEINLLLVNLLRRSGLTANPVLMRNRYSGSLNMNYPTRSDLNYVIAQVQLDNKVMYLDATDKNISAGQLPNRAINQDGVLVTEEGGVQLDIYNSNVGVTSKVQELVISDSGLSGTYQAKYQRYSAYKMHRSFNSNKDFVDMVGVRDGATITNAEVSGLENKIGDVSLSATINYQNYIQEIDGKLFIDYALNLLPKSSPFIRKDRQFALFFDSRENETNIIKYKIPEGYQMEYLPESINVTLPDRIMMAVIGFTSTDSEIVVTIRKSIKEDIISPQYYASVLEYYDTIIAKGNEKIILTKI